MPIASIRPSTVDGIKQLATKLKRAQQITHTAALDAASRQAGFENFVHARRQLSQRQVFPVYLTVHWVQPRADRTGKGPWAGRELLRVELSRPLAEVVAKHRVSSARGLDGFRMEYSDHLEHLTNVSGQDSAHDRLRTAARSLRFMEATGLQPVTTQALRERANALRELPGRDHTSSWFDPASNAVLVIDEPYRDAVKHRQEERDLWARSNGATLVNPQWEGIYYPGECVPHLVSKDAGLVDRIAKTLEALKPLEIQTPWPFPGARNGEDFVSPQREADAKPRKPRPGPSYRNFMGATPYGGAPGIPSRWRPTQSMPLELHKQLGSIFQRNVEFGLPFRMESKVAQQRATLEDWMALEHGGAATDGVYYGGAPLPSVKGRAAQREGLLAARAMVERGYNDCKPRRDMLAVLDAAVAELST